MYIFGCEKQSAIQRHFLLVFRGENNIQTMNRCLCTEKMSVNFLLLFRAENHHQTMIRHFFTEKILIILKCVFFPQRKCCWISYWFSDSKIMRFFFDWENVDEFSTVFQNRKWSSNYDALFFHRENVAKFVTVFQNRKSSSYYNTLFFHREKVEEIQRHFLCGKTAPYSLMIIFDSVKQVRNSATFSLWKNSAL